METMNYDKVSKKGVSAGMVAFLLIIVLGTIVVVYGMMNEPKATLLGQDALVNVYEDKAVETIAKPIQTIKYKVSDAKINERTGNFKANVTIPKIQIESIGLGEINDKIYSKFQERYTTLKEENAKSLENKFTYKVTYKKYESTLESGEKIISFTIYERIIDDAKGIDTMYKIYGYTINLNTRKILTQDDICPIVLGPTYKTIIRQKVKDYIITGKMINEENYTYSMTGLEEFYIKEGKFHIVFNSGDLANKKYDHLDITITK